MNKQENINEERCDNESEVLNARVEKDERIISNKEYEQLTQELGARRNIMNKQREENSILQSENKELKKENEEFKNGILNFIKILGGIWMLIKCKGKDLTKEVKMQNIDKLDRIYYWHIVTLLRLQYRLKILKGGK